MEKIGNTRIGDLTIEGMEGDYIFETIKKNNQFYENTILKKWLPYIGESKIIFDVGANLGNHTLFWTQRVNYSFIYCFEPHPVNYERLTNNVMQNHLNHVIPVNYGVGACKGYSNILEFSKENYGATVLDSAIKDSGDIKIIDIDSFVSEQKIDSIDFIKVDTEGFEESVLAGMKNTIAFFHPDLWIEVSEASFCNVIELLRSQKYIMADVEGFNILFLSEERHTDIPQIDSMNILRQHFNNLSRVNKYYQNYNTAKEWANAKSHLIEKLSTGSEAKEKKIEDLSEQLQDKNRKIFELKEQLYRDNEVLKKIADITQLQNEQIEVMLHAKESIQEKEKALLSLRKDNGALKQQLQNIENRDNEFAQELIDIIQAQDSQIRVLLHAKHVIQTQQRELLMLRQENEQNKQRWDRLSNKWYGKLALKIYYKLRVMNILK